MIRFCRSLSICCRVSLLAGVLVVAAPSTSGATGSQRISWLAAGDSYSSGAGLKVTTKPCARGSVTSSSYAYPLLAYDDVHSALPSLETPNFVACTGATSSEFISGNDTAGRPEWTPSMGKFDLVTFTFGGDDINFHGIILQCLAYPISKLAPPDPDHSCPNDSFVRNLIKTKLGSVYRSFLTQVADKVVAKGGNIVVLGYPELVDLPKFWPSASQHIGKCQGLRTSDATQLRGDAGALNATIGADVAEVNRQHPNGVHLTFVDVNTGSNTGVVKIPSSDQDLFEPSVGGRHNLCGTGTSWLNGVVKLHPTRSFHPSEDGNIAEGKLLASVLPYLSEPPVKVVPPTTTNATVPPTTSPANAGYAPGDAFNDYCVIAWPTAPGYTSDSIQMTMTCQHVPEGRFLFTDVIYRSTTLHPTPDTGYMHVVGRVLDVATSAYGFSELEVEATSVTL